MKFIIVIGALLAVIVSSSFYIDRYPGFSDEGLLRHVEDDVLGKKPLYKETCLRSYYKEEVGWPYGKDSVHAAIFVFYARDEYRDICPTIQITASKYTGEVWIDIVDESQPHEQRKQRR